MSKYANYLVLHLSSNFIILCEKKVKHFLIFCIFKRTGPELPVSTAHQLALDKAHARSSSLLLV